MKYLDIVAKLLWHIRMLLVCGLTSSAC